MSIIFYAYGMQPSLPAKEPLSIKRHCMQALLHRALASPSTFGLLAARGNTIEAIVPLTEHMLMAADNGHQDTAPGQAQLATAPLRLIGVYQATDNDGNINPGQRSQLSSYFEKQSGGSANCFLLLALGTEGRLDALMFADPELCIPIPLDMQEDQGQPACNPVPDCPE